MSDVGSRFYEKQYPNRYDTNRFVNPYNFIQFPEKKAVAYKDSDRHTGVIEYAITTETPLFIPNSSSETAFRESDKIWNHKSCDFFSYTELNANERYDGRYQSPVIPGSEMRGVVRMVYETLTDSCMGLLNEEKHPEGHLKEVSQYSLKELAGEFAPCKENYCPACDLFGYVGENGQQRKGFGLRFADLYPEKKEKPEQYYACDKVVLETLAEPNLVSTEFYLRKPDGNPSFWTYDYYVNNGRQQEGMGKIRGRKYYWHHRKVNMSKHVRPERRNRTIRPVREGISFTGKLYFDGISEKQLKQLVWILNSGSEKLGLKLGGAKPLGYGSISCKVDAVQERILSVESGKICYEMRTRELTDISYEEAGLSTSLNTDSTSVKDEFYKIAGLETIPKNVEITYPKDYTQKDHAISKGYQWFVNNHKNPQVRLPKKGEDFMIRHALPKILDQDITMAYSEPEKPKNSFYSFDKKR